MTTKLNQWFVMFYYFPFFKQIPLASLVNSSIKKFLVLAHLPLSIISSIIKNLLYIGVIMLMAFLINRGFPAIEIKVLTFSFLLFFMILNRMSVLFVDVPDRWSITKQLHVHPQVYYNNSFLWHMMDRVLYSITLFLITMNFGLSYGAMIALVPIVISLQIELFVSLYFKKYEKKPSKLLHIISFIVSVIFALLVLLVAYLNKGVFIVLVLEIIAISGGALLLKNMNIASDVQRYMINFMDINITGENIMDKVNNDTLRGDDDVIVEDLTQEFENLSGYTLLNKLFFKRHKRLWLKPLKITSYVFLFACIVIVIVRLFVSSFDPTYLASVTSLNFDYNVLSGPLLFIIFLTNRTEVLTKSMYFNCDYSFLHYPFYKQKEFIWKQYLVRFKSCILINLAHPVSFLLAILLAIGLGLAPFDLNSLVRLSINLFCGNLIITALFLSLYYIFQPFTKDMTVKNGFYTFFTSALSFFFIYSREFLSYVTTLIWAMPLIFIITLTASLIGVSILAPKNFKYKN